MKSESRSTPEVRTKRSKGGSLAVNICLERVEGVMSSGEGYTGLEEATRVDGPGFTVGEADVGGLSATSGWRVVEEDMDEPSIGSDMSDDSDVVLDDGDCGVGASRSCHLAGRSFV